MQYPNRKHISISVHLLVILILTAAFGFTTQVAQAGVNVDIQAHVGPGAPPPPPVVHAAPPPLEMTAPPDVVVVPSEQYPNQYVYMVPEMEGVYFYQGAWYRSYNGTWYTAPAYNAIWTPIEVAIVPPVIVSVPREYVLFLPNGYYRIHYADYHEHWKAWERERRWEKQNWYRNELRAEVRQERMAHIEARRAEVKEKIEKEHMQHERHIAAHQSLEKEEGIKPHIASHQSLGKDEAKNPHIAVHQGLGREKVADKKHGNQPVRQLTVQEKLQQQRQRQQQQQRQQPNVQRQVNKQQNHKEEKEEKGKK